MGARNVSAVFAMWPDIPTGPKLLLVWMALQSLDSTSPAGRPARVYFGGETAMQQALCCPRRQVYRHLAHLVQKGAVQRVERGQPGQRAVYRLALDPFDEHDPQGL